ncbi:MAG: hypothetical protein V4471_05300 [Pseudomonadota bacterium]
MSEMNSDEPTFDETDYKASDRPNENISLDNGYDAENDEKTENNKKDKNNGKVSQDGKGSIEFFCKNIVWFKQN